MKLLLGHLGEYALKALHHSRCIGILFLIPAVLQEGVIDAIDGNLSAVLAQNLGKRSRVVAVGMVTSQAITWPPFSLI